MKEPQSPSNNDYIKHIVRNIQPTCKASRPDKIYDWNSRDFVTYTGPDNLRQSVYTFIVLSNDQIFESRYTEEFSETENTSLYPGFFKKIDNVWVGISESEYFKLLGY